MRRSAKRSRNAAGKSLGDMCAGQKALATVGSSVRGGASASMVSSTVAVLPILFFSGLVARNFWKTAPPLAAVPSELLSEVDRDLLQQVRVIALEMQPFLKLDE